MQVAVYSCPKVECKYDGISLLSCLSPLLHNHLKSQYKVFLNFNFSLFSSLLSILKSDFILLTYYPEVHIIALSFLQHMAQLTMPPLLILPPHHLALLSLFLTNNIFFKILTMLWICNSLIQSVQSNGFLYSIYTELCNNHHSQF